MNEHCARRTLLDGLFVLASAAATLAAVPPYDFAAAAFVCWVPLLVRLDGARLPRAFALGLAHGVLVNLGSVYWLAAALHEAGGLSLGASVGALCFVAAFQGVRSALVAAVFSAARRNLAPGWLCLPPTLVLIEMLFPFLFPWTTALFVHDVPEWMQLAEIGGPHLVSAWIALVNVGIAEALRPTGAEKRRGSLVLAGSALLVVSAFGALRIRSIDGMLPGAERADVGLIHGNFAAASGADAVSQYRAASVELLREKPLDLIVWPETAIPYALRADDVSAYVREHVFAPRAGDLSAKGISVPVLTGIVLEGEASEALFNAAVLVSHSGQLLGSYAKQALVPVGEKAPLSDWWPSAEALWPPATKFTAGTHATPIAIGGRRISVFICYEDILHALVRRAVRDGEPDLLVNLTSDAWFGDSPAAKLHFALAKFRAVEHRRYLVRATNLGVSGVVDPTGRVLAAFDERRVRASVASVRFVRGSTIYGRIGDAPLAALAALALAVALLRRTKPRSGSAVRRDVSHLDDVIRA